MDDFHKIFKENKLLKNEFQILDTELIKSSNSVAKNGNASKERKSRDKKYAVTSVAFNFMFLFLKTPFSIYYILYAFTNYFNVYFLNITILLTSLNSALFIFVHLLTNSLYRREFLIFFRLAKRNEEISSNTVSRNTINRAIALNRINPSSTVS